MKKLLLVLLLFVSQAVKSQDTIYLINKVRVCFHKGQGLHKVKVNYVVLSKSRGYIVNKRNKKIYFYAIKLKRYEPSK